MEVADVVFAMGKDQINVTFIIQYYKINSTGGAQKSI